MKHSVLVCSAVAIISFSPVNFVLADAEAIPDVTFNPNLAEDVGLEFEQDMPDDQPTEETCSVRQVNFTKTLTADRYTRLAINASEEARGSSCLMDVLASSFDWESYYKTHRIAFDADQFAASGSFLFQHYGKDYKWSDEAVISWFWDKLLEISGLDSADYDGNKQYLRCSQWGNPGSDSQGGRIGGGNSSQPACFTGSLFLDGQCRLLPASQSSEICGMMNIEYVASTPISLLLDSGAEVLNDARPVEFKLDPASKASVWEWRASGKAPLLVYDPEKSGKITSATQLFGNWTFGGKTHAALAESSAQGWSNGFEALGVLDLDRDGSVAGQEAAALALWFDYNRDGISQPGEVQSLSAAGIQSLHYAADKIDPVTGDVTASAGFRRLIGGRLETGAMVDWIGKGASSAFDLALGNQLNPVHVLPEAQPRQSAFDRELQQNWLKEQTAARAGETEAKTAGTWIWTIEQGGAGFGIFTIADEKQNFVSGQSMVELEFSKRAQGFKGRSMIQFSSFEGAETQAPGQALELSFVSTSSGIHQHSLAKLSANGKSMIGTTTGKGNDGRTLTYSWKANRLEEKPRP